MSLYCTQFFFDITKIWLVQRRMNDCTIVAVVVVVIVIVIISFLRQVLSLVLGVISLDPSSGVISC